MVPCFWEVTHSPTSKGPAVAFATHHRFHGVGLAEVKVILDPSNWMTYTPPWCQMVNRGGALGRKYGTLGTNARFLEVVADDCRRWKLPLPVHNLSRLLDDQTFPTGAVASPRVPAVSSAAVQQW